MANAFFTRPMTALKRALSRLRGAKKRLIVILLLAAGCASVPEINQIPAVVLGEPSFFPTIAAHTDAPIVGGNRVDLLFNGEQIFPAMLEAIRGARKSITYAQYLYKDGAIAHELAEALAERCRAGVQVKILIDDHGGSEMPEDIPTLWRNSACHLEWFRRIRLFQFITPWELLSYNYRNHRRILVIDGKIGFTGGHGVDQAWTGTAERQVTGATPMSGSKDPSFSNYKPRLSRAGGKPPAICLAMISTSQSLNRGETSIPKSSRARRSAELTNLIYSFCSP